MQAVSIIQTIQQNIITLSLTGSCLTADSHTDMDNHQLYNNGSVVQFSTSWRGCAIEKNMDYLWNDLNDGLQDKQPDVVSCLYFCKSMEAKYFSWTGMG